MAKKGLGRGLDSLIPDAPEEQKEFQTVSLSFVEPNRKQPRQTFDEEELEALAESVKLYGVLQPITVKEEGNGFYSIIAGERRWRAAKKAGLKEVPVRVVALSPKEELEIALIENLQRSDLNPVEEALGYQQLMDEHEMTQEEVSARVGKNRSTVANALRLLALPAAVQDLLKERKITGGHARAILSVKDSDQRIYLTNRIVDEELSVRQAEALAQLLNKPKTKAAPHKAKTPEVLDLEQQLSERMGTKVLLDEHKKGGRIEIEYYDEAQRETLLNYLKKFKK